MTATVDTTNSTTMTAIPLSLIDAGDNDRKKFDPVELESLAASIKQLGLIEPIIVRPVAGRYRIAAGERRYRAHVLLDASTILAVVMPGLDDWTEDAIMLAENLGRVDLDPVAEAFAYQRRLDAGATTQELAAAVGVTVARITSRLPLLRLCPEGQRLASAGSLSVTHAMVLARLDNDRQVMALRSLSEQDLTYFEFRDVCTMLEEDQQNESLFGDDLALVTEQFVEAAKEQRARVPRSQLVDLIRRLADSSTDARLAAVALDAVANEK